MRHVVGVWALTLGFLGSCGDDNPCPSDQPIQYGGMCVQCIARMNQSGGTDIEGCESRPHSVTTCPGSLCEYACETGYEDCDGDPTNGCEASLGAVTSCGRCGNVCSAGDFCSATGCRPFSLGWSYTFGGIADLNGQPVPGIDRATGVAVDSDGDIYLAGELNGGAQYAGSTFPANGIQWGAFLIKLRGTDARQEWAKNFTGSGGAGSAWSKAIAVSSGSNAGVFVTGNFLGTVNFEKESLTNESGTSRQDLFIVKVPLDGSEPTWVNSYGGGGSDSGYAVALSPSGDVVVGGSFEQGIRFENVPTIESFGGTDGLVIGLYGDGRFRWVQRFGTTGDDSVQAVVASENGVVFATGCLARGTNCEMFVDAMTPVERSSQSLWRVVSSGLDSASTIGVSLAIDNEGALYVMGNYRGSVVFGGQMLSTTDALYDVFVMKLDAATGKVLWARSFDENLEIPDGKLVLDQNGMITAANSFDGTFALDGRTFSSTVDGRIFLSSFAPGGEIAGMRAIGRSDYALTVGGLSVDKDGRLAVVGGFKELLTLPNTTLNVHVSDSVNQEMFIFTATR